MVEQLHHLVPDLRVLFHLGNAPALLELVDADFQLLFQLDSLQKRVQRAHLFGNRRARKPFCQFGKRFGNISARPFRPFRRFSAGQGFQQRVSADARALQVKLQLFDIAFRAPRIAALEIPQQIVWRISVCRKANRRERGVYRRMPGQRAFSIEKDGNIPNRTAPAKQGGIRFQIRNDYRHIPVANAFPRAALHSFG
ncbi:hypothetical protein SDC9_75139 [bioreactor metagenome]|uniref:Uncharacterized protein n=1 Tax=bioreactor metagenome TaxID=1076179 RepID=A0A644YQ56_9ZZZZ